MKLYAIPEKVRSDDGAFSSIENKSICKNRNVKLNTVQHQMHTGNRTMERARPKVKIVMIANMEVGKHLAESVQREFRVMRIIVHTGRKKLPLEVHHDKTPKTIYQIHFFQFGHYCLFQHRQNQKSRYM